MATDKDPDGSTGTWGKYFFAIVLIATLAFFWWLLIYDQGVTSAH